MFSLSEYIINQCVDNSIIKSEVKEIYCAGLRLILADIINFSLILLIGALFNELIVGTTFLLCFFTTRIFCGGFHSKTAAICRLSMISTFTVVLFCYKALILQQLIPMIIFNIISIVVVAMFAPVKHPNKELTDKAIKKNKIRGIIITVIFIAGSFTLYFIGRNEGVVISLTLFLVALLMIIGLFTNKFQGGRLEC